MPRAALGLPAALLSTIVPSKLASVPLTFAALGEKVGSMVRQLGQLEAVVMQHVWSADGPVAVREVLEGLQRDRSIAYTTVMTVMDNLHRKGLLAREMEGRAYRYRPVKSREQHNAELMSEVLSASTDRSVTLMHFLEHMPAEDLARLRAALAQGTADSEGPTV